MSRPFGEVSYTLIDLVVAAYDDTDASYGTPESVADGMMFVAEVESDTDKMNAYGVTTRGLAVLKGSKISFKAGGVDLSVLTAIAGTVVTESGASGNRVKTFRQAAGGSGMGYFGAIGVTATDDGGVMVVGHRAVKLDTFPTITMDGETNKYTIFETEGFSFVRNSELFVGKAYEDATDWVKPTNGSEFAAFFA